MGDLKSRKLIVLKGALFLLAGALASIALVVRNPELMTALLLVIAIWCFARFYYFVFYVIEKYVDPGFRYSGTFALVRYFARNRSRKPGHPERTREGSRVAEESRSLPDYSSG